MTIRKVGIIGAGTMGSGIATATAAAGVAVRLFDMSADTVARAIAGAGTFYDRAVEKNRMSAEAATAARALLAPATQLSELADCDLIIEAVFEDLGIKGELFGKLNPIVADSALVATNTSCLKVDDLARGVKRPERFLGLHYFSPAQVSPLVEVVRGAVTDEASFAAALAFVEATGKRPLRCKDQRGFALNRFFCPYTNEAVRLLDEGIGTPAQIDKVAQEVLGAAAGPFVVMNLVKPRINLHAIRNLEPLGAFYAPADSMVKQGEADAPWTIDSSAAGDPAHEAIIAARLRGGAFLPTLQELDEEVATPADIDMGARLALKFSRPPCEAMDALGRAAVEKLVAPLCERHGCAVPASLARVGSLLG